MGSKAPMKVKSVFLPPSSGMGPGSVPEQTRYDKDDKVHAMHTSSSSYEHWWAKASCKCSHVSPFVCWAPWGPIPK